MAQPKVQRNIKVTLWQSLLYKKFLIIPLNLFFSMVMSSHETFGTMCVRWIDNKKWKPIFDIIFISSGELSGSLMYTRLQTRLNPVPESLNSPDLAPPGSASGIGRPPAKDDPIRVYNRELAVSSSTVSTTSSSSIKQTTSNTSTGALMPNHAAKTKEDNETTNGYRYVAGYTWAQNRYIWLFLNPQSGSRTI